jgi:hypothetical protein
MIFAILLKARFAIPADAAGIYEAPDPGEITCFESCDLGAYPRHTPHDFMPRDHRINGVAPLVAGLMYVGVTYATVENLDEYVIRPRFAPLEVEGFELIGRASGRVSACW